MKTSFPGVFVRSISTALPKKSLELISLAPLFGEKKIRRIMAYTGIEKVKVAEAQQCTSDLCLAAAEQLFHEMNISSSVVDGIVFVSQTPDYILPATSAVLQNRLGIPSTAVAFDISYGCSGYIYGLYQAAMLIVSGGCKSVLLCVGDVITRLLHEKDRSVRLVFGDGGSATLLERGDDSLYFNLKTDGSGAKYLIVPAGGFRQPRSSETQLDYKREDGHISNEECLFMDGLEIMNFALREVPVLVEELLEMRGWQKTEVSLYAFHQASRFLLEYLAERMNIAKELLPIAVANVGNTGPASIPVMLSLEHEKLRKNNQLDKVLACGFGVGLSWAAATLSLAATKILSPVQV